MPTNAAFRVGKSELKVSQIILGCMSFGDSNWQPWLLNKDEALTVLKYAFGKGINTWDVADTYSSGESERILGATTSTITFPAPSWMDRDVPQKEIMKALNDVIESGKVRYGCASSMLQNVSHQNGWHKFISMQGLYNLLYREEEREMNPYCNYTGVDRTDAREQKDPFLKLLFRGGDQNTDRAIVDRVEELAQKKGVAMTQIAQSWLIAKGCMPICGMESEEKIDQAVGALQVTLSDEEIKHLEELYVPKVPFPF
ncbi:alcohol dehydrogenase [Fusarium phyllophilum]|uniref:Alcohol dehydrogenase n=1 Tax=Fusarium phyllophilum TaxID=47803 RepID=A0A8H5IZ69_9HYPO|nr:alcohol dehydrogenase [Fusarium phyllophilum]